MSDYALMNARGSLECAYPGTAIVVPNKVFDDERFQTELANFLSLPGKADSDPPNVPADHPEYITGLLTGILRSVGHIVERPLILKRVRDDFGLSGTSNHWRRSSLWLLLRVTIQTSLDRSPPGRASYKAFMLFFTCNLAKDANNAGLSSNLLYLMSAKILRRLRKLGSFVPGWLSDIVLETSIGLQDTLDVRTVETQASELPSRYWNPSELDLTRDTTQLSLPHCNEYICNTRTNPGRTSLNTPFHPKDYYRGTLADFLSSDTTFFDRAYIADPCVTLYDVQRSVEQGIDDWLAHVTNVEEACTQLGALMDVYLLSASVTYTDNPEYHSIMTLTALELWVAIDKLVIGGIPMLAEYSPEIPICLLESLLLRETIALHRLSRIYQYLHVRHSRSCTGFSVLSDEFTEDSFPVRYYDSSPGLQNMKSRMESGAIRKMAESGELSQGGVASLALTFRGYLRRFTNPWMIRPQLDGVPKSLVPILPLHLKAVAFELQCPSSFRVWRSALTHLLYRFDKARIKPFESEFKPHDLLSDVPELQPYVVHHLRPAYSQFHLAYYHQFGPGPCKMPRLGYAFEQFPLRSDLLEWQKTIDGLESQHTTYGNIKGIPPDFRSCHLVNNFEGDEASGKGDSGKYIEHTTHTSNDVVSAQAHCPAGSTLAEFIALGHLRSGGALQWINILREFRGRTLNLCSDEVHLSLAQATSHVGSLDVVTGEWIWHQELQHPHFCNLLLEELESLFLDVSASSLDELSMRTISMLVTRVVASSPSEDVLERALHLLRDVRSKTLRWVQDLAYNLMQAPMNVHRCHRLYNMAATCRSTFDINTGTLRKVLYSAEDVEALLSCAFFIYATGQLHYLKKCDQDNCHPGHFVGTPSYYNWHSELLYHRDRRLSVTVEGILKDVIEADASDRGIDLAVRAIWPGYQPGPQRWEPEQHPNTHWLVSTTAGTPDRRSQTVRINLLDGSLLVDGRPLGGLPREIREHPLYKQLFAGVCTTEFCGVDALVNSFLQNALVVIPSDLPDMDFVTLALIHNHCVSNSKYRLPILGF